MGSGSSRSLKLDGKKLRAARKRQGMRQGEFELRSGVSLATIRRAESDRPIYVGNARALADTLKIPLPELLAEAEIAKSTQSASRLPPSVAVLPFKRMSSDADCSYLADGLVQDLVHRLARSLFPVISASSVLRGAPAVASLRDWGEVLGAAYLIDGTTQRVGTRVRVTVQIIRSKDARVLQSYKYDQKYDDVFAAQDQLASRIVDGLGGLLLKLESDAQDRRPSDMTAWELVVRGCLEFNQGTTDANQSARAFFEQALCKDRDIPLAWYSLTLTHQRDLLNQWSLDPAHSLRAMKETAAEFTRLFPREPWSLVSAAYVSVYDGQRDLAMTTLSRAIELDPNLPTARSLYGQTLAMANEPERALEQFDIALRLSPLDSEVWAIYTAKALAHFVAYRYGEALEWAARATKVQPSASFPHGTRASALAHLGRLDEAGEALQRMLTLAPNSSLHGMGALIASTDREIAGRYYLGLRDAGLRA